jgi:hypothetical protein
MATNKNESSYGAQRNLNALNGERLTFAFGAAMASSLAKGM